MGAECRAGESAAARYRPRRPSQSVLYRCVQQHLETWLAQYRDSHDDEWSVPEYVEREFRRYLDCGILARGFARVRCGQCGHDFLIAFSCQGRGVCPSCNTRRMVATAAHLTDHVLPPLPVRQWVLAVPKRLRYFLQRDADLQGAALRLFLRVVEQCLRAHSRAPGARRASARWSSSIASVPASIRIYTFTVSSSTVCSTPLPPAGSSSMPRPGSTPTPSPRCRSACAGACCASSCTAACCRALMRRPWGNGSTAVASPWKARCASRPLTAPGASGCCAIAPGRRSPWNRLRELDPERLLYESTKPGPGGNGSLLLTPLELLDRLAALVPPPRVHRCCYFGVLARTAAHGDVSGVTPSGRTWPVTATDPRSPNGCSPSLPDLHGNSSRVCNAAIAVVQPMIVNWRSRPQPDGRPHISICREAAVDEATGAW